MQCLQRLLLLILLCHKAGRVSGQRGQTINVSAVDPTVWLHECFETFQEYLMLPNIHINYSNQDLIRKPSGLCVDNLSCAFEKCNSTGIVDYALYMTTNWTNATDDDIKNVFLPLLFTNLTNLTFQDIEDTLGPLNLPSMITFPKTAADVVEAIQYAKDHNLTVSVKTSGHSYPGSSNQKGSLQLNLRDLKKYSNGSIVECVNVHKDSPDFAACKLATARGKNAIITVGGGELWSDVYTSVFNANYTSERYDIMGAFTASIGAAGGWIGGGGLSGTGTERMYGLGVDQVLELQMVLPDGRHVKFGPTKWEEAENFLYPKTTQVGGKCNANSMAQNDEDAVWETCEDPIPPFADLWFAVRGGGGGTYGVVTSLKYQLHNYKPLVVLQINGTSVDSILATIGNNETLSNQAVRLFLFFVVDFLFNPSKLNVDEATSNLCGSPSTNSLDFTNKNMALFCYDDSASVFQEAWVAKVRNTADFDFISEDLEKLLLLTPVDNYSEAWLAYLNIPSGPTDYVSDIPTAALIPDFGLGGWCSAQLPLKWLQEANDDVFEVLAKSPQPSHLTGGNVAFAQDQMTAVPQTERLSGFSSTTLLIFDQDFLEQLLSSFLKDTVDNGGSFPGITEFNHMCANSATPLRKNMTAFCPSTYTDEQKEKECYSIQEGVWGVDTLKKLENIKYAIDPNNVFDCYPCVKPKKSSIESFFSTNDIEMSMSYQYLSYFY